MNGLTEDKLTFLYLNLKQTYQQRLSYFFPGADFGGIDSHHFYSLIVLNYPFTATLVILKYSLCESKQPQNANAYPFVFLDFTSLI